MPQTIDNHAVDSGFSSSSPADRQSPSPQTRFDIQPVSNIEENANLDPPTSSETVNITPILRNTQNQDIIKASSSPHGVDQAQNNSGVPDVHNLEPSFSQTSANNIFNQPPKVLENSMMQQAVPPHPGLSDEINHQMPIASNSGIVHSSYSQQAQAIQTSESAVNSSESGPTQAMSDFIKNLTAQVTGQSSIKKEPAVEPTVETAPGPTVDPTDPAYIIKHNKVAVPPNCGCTNRECKLKTDCFRIKIHADLVCLMGDKYWRLHTLGSTLYSSKFFIILKPKHVVKALAVSISLQMMRILKAHTTSTSELLTLSKEYVILWRKGK